MQKIIVVNSGSVSKKYALYEGPNLIMSFHFEENPGPESDYILHLMKENSFNKDLLVNDLEFNDAFEYLLKFLKENSFIGGKDEIDAVVFRVVAPGDFFTSDRIINDEFLEKLDEIKEDTPMHIKKMQTEFNQVSDSLGKVKMIAVSDSRFHKTLPNKASVYALPKEISSELEIKKYGYHGISVSSVVGQLKKDKNIPEKTIVCHLGGGSSITALKNGESVENSMGYSPLDGLPMSTRTGSMDVGIIVSLENKLDMDFPEIRDMSYYKSGLTGISGKTGDIRELIELESQGDKDAKLALDKFVYEIQKTIGAYTVVLGGLDALIFTGTIGERSSEIRKRVCKGLKSVGVVIDEKLNTTLGNSTGYINNPGSDVQVEVVYANEVEEMLKRALDLI
jgi:acetate kinase